MGSYEDVAAEYYDSHRHPTSANFREASDLILLAWTVSRLPRAGLLCDVGAGDSALASLLSLQGRSLRRLRIIDASKKMLNYSKRWARLGAQLVVGEAEALPLNDHSVAMLVASLGDPFNRQEFWHEARRVLKPDGTVIFTTPSFEWASRFRAENHEPQDAAEFLTKDTRAVLVPSFVHSERQQLDLMNRAGVCADGVYHVFQSALQGLVSPKITESLPARAPLVTGYLGRLDRPQPRPRTGVVVARQSFLA